MAYGYSPGEKADIKKRMAEKDAYFIVLNASNVASELLAAKIQVDASFQIADKQHILAEWESIRNDVIASNVARVAELISEKETKDLPPE